MEDILVLWWPNAIGAWFSFGCLYLAQRLWYNETMTTPATPSSTLRTWGMRLTLVACLLGLAVKVPSAPAAQVPTPEGEGWTLLFADDFNGPANSLPSSVNWRIDTGTQYPNGPAQWGTHEIETYTRNPANLRLDGQGHLLITPQRDRLGNWTSARIETQQDTFKAMPGQVLHIEARIQMPAVTGDAALGYWPAFWALGGNFRQRMNWPQAGEFDIMESVNGLDRVWGILHCGVNPDGPCGEPFGIGSNLPCPNTACTAGFHTYAFEWDRRTAPEELRWMVDGQIVNRVMENQLPPATWQELTQQNGYFIILNVAMGGGFSYAMAGGKPTPTATTEPGHPMVVDYVSVWTRAMGVPEKFTQATAPVKGASDPTAQAAR